MTDLNKIFPMKRSEFEISRSIESYDYKTSENRRNLKDDEKNIVLYRSLFLIDQPRLCQNLMSVSTTLSEI